MKTIIIASILLTSTLSFAQNNNDIYKQWYDQQTTNSQQNIDISTGRVDANSNNYQYDRNRELENTNCQVHKKWNSYTNQYEYVTVCN